MNEVNQIYIILDKAALPGSWITETFLQTSDIICTQHRPLLLATLKNINVIVMYMSRIMLKQLGLKMFVIFRI